MNTVKSDILSYYDKEVVLSIKDKYGFSLMDAYRKYIYSETYQLLIDPKLEMFDFSPDGIFDMWECEQIAGNPRISLYLGSDDRD